MVSHSLKYRLTRSSSPRKHGEAQETDSKENKTMIHFTFIFSLRQSGAEGVNSGATIGSGATDQLVSCKR
jgi:hypothetical protein